MHSAVVMLINGLDNDLIVIDVIAIVIILIVIAIVSLAARQLRHHLVAMVVMAMPRAG